MSATWNSIGLGAQISAVERELALRIRNYPKWVRDGKMRQQDADYQIAAMEAVLGTLRGVRDAMSGRPM